MFTFQMAYKQPEELQQQNQQQQHPSKEVLLWAAKSYGAATTAHNLLSKEFYGIGRGRTAIEESMTQNLGALVSSKARVNAKYEMLASTRLSENDSYNNLSIAYDNLCNVSKYGGTEKQVKEAQNWYAASLDLYNDAANRLKAPLADYTTTSLGEVLSRLGEAADLATTVVGAVKTGTMAVQGIRAAKAAKAALILKSIPKSTVPKIPEPQSLYAKLVKPADQMAESAVQQISTKAAKTAPVPKTEILKRTKLRGEEEWLKGLSD